MSGHNKVEMLAFVITELVKYAGIATVVSLLGFIVYISYGLILLLPLTLWAFEYRYPGCLG